MSLIGRSTLVLSLALASFTGCGGAGISVLHVKGKPTHDGPAQVIVSNASGTTIEQVFFAPMNKVEAAHAAGAAPDSVADRELWGDDELGNGGLLAGSESDGLNLPEGRYDVLVLDHDRREQLVKGLMLRAGGKYVLEVRDDWSMGR